MNKNEIEKLMRDIIPCEMRIRSDVCIDDVSVNLEKATPSQIVFYRLHRGEKAKELFLERYKKSPGCLLFINSKLDEIKENFVIIDEARFFEIQKKILDYIFPLPKTLPKMVGITGTNGKTSVVNLSMQVAKLLGKRAVSVGTIGVAYSDDKKSNVVLNGTTPSYIDFRKIIYETQADYDACFFEFSSHALKQDRIHDLLLDLAAWTNLTQDHLDYHRTMEDYFNSKLKICTKYLKEEGMLIVSNGQKELYERVKKIFSNVVSPDKIQADRQNKIPPFFRVAFNRENLEVALMLNSILWNCDCGDIVLDEIKLPPGRFEIIDLLNSNYAVVDYAHTPDALERLLIEAKKAFADKKISIIFGCGGDRDRSKRALMGKVAKQNADFVCVTSDNPRKEVPSKIMEDILAGMGGKADYVEENREQAICSVLKNLVKDEVVIIAGKGHEQYQEFNGIKYNYSDYDVIKRFLNDQINRA